MLQTRRSLFRYQKALRETQVFFLVAEQERTKEVGIGEALSVALPRAKAALSYVPHPARTWYLPSTLTIRDFLE